MDSNDNVKEVCPGSLRGRRSDFSGRTGPHGTEDLFYRKEVRRSDR